MGDWASVETEITRILAESDTPFHPNTVANAREFSAVLDGRCEAPTVGTSLSPVLAGSLGWTNCRNGLVAP